MHRAVAVRAKGTWPADREMATATLPFGDRFRRRILLNDDAGEPFLLDLARAVILDDGAGLEMADGGYIRVIAAPEAVIDIECSCPEDLARIAWHLGNRHLPVQILSDRALRVADDPTIEAMLNALGAAVRRRRAAFSPDAGAYAGAGHLPQPARTGDHD